MPRVLHLLPSFGWGGAEKIACTMHRLSRAQGWQSQLDAPALEPLARGVAQDTGDSLPASAHERTLRTWALAARARARAFRPDVVHAHLPYPDRIGAVVLAVGGRPVVFTFGLLPEEGRVWPADQVLRVRSDRALALAARLMRRTCFVAVSAADTASLARWVPSRRLRHVANAPPLPPALLPAPPPVPWPEGAARLLSVGRLHRQKGFDRLLAALALEPLRSLPWHWTIVGEGEERAALEKAAAEAGLSERVTILSGYAASVIYPSAELVLSPSRYEGLPLVPMEAVEAGLPVLASDIAPHRELFAGAPGSIVPDEPARWAERIAELLRDPDERAALRARQRSALPADPRHGMWNAYEALYRALIRE